ncbi:MAG: FHA domain-containing protein [Anaerolineae bacterium]|nr:FHA domain-containing protein [Anaerolineae bacterium]
MSDIAAAFQVKLSWEDNGTGEPQEVNVNLPATLGRDNQNTVVLNSHQVSRRHARLDFEDDQVVLIDEGSSNGVYVGGEPITRHPVVSGANFDIRPFNFTVTFADNGHSENGHDKTQLIDAKTTLVGLEQELYNGSAAPAAKQSLPPELVVEWKNTVTHETRRLSTQPPITVGRAETNTITLTGDRSISRHHAKIDIRDDQIVVSDAGSSAGTFINDGEQSLAQPSKLMPQDTIRIGQYQLKVTKSGPHSDDQSEEEAQTTFTHVRSISAIADEANLTTLTNLQPPSSYVDDGVTSKTTFPSETEIIRLMQPDFPPEAFNQPVVSVEEIHQMGVPVDQTTYLALGGGLGSFTWVDYLRNSGVDLGLITVIGIKDKPFERYRQLCRNSQIPNHERLRSDSGSTPDNIWGWPGYAVREAWHDLLHFRLGNALKVMWTIFGEPTLANTYTPISDNVYQSIEAEARRIGWQHIWRFGRIMAIRKTNDGRYVVAYSQTNNDKKPLYRLMLANYVHLAIGYPGIQFLPDLQAYRQQTNDFEHVVNAYEPHDHIYDHLVQHGGTVLVRGRGIVASRIIQRLYEVRKQNDKVVILHLNRSPRPVGNRFGRAGRRVEHHWEFQPFNWPKANWGGDLRAVLEKANTNERDELYNDWGGSTTADRADWRKIVDTGLKEYWYQIRFGRVSKVERRNDKLVTTIDGYGHFNENTELLADFIIDATGLNSSIDSHPLLKDMLDLYNLERNAKGRLHVANDFEVPAMRNETESHHGRFYASGVMTLGGPYAPVDSFLGLQYAALRSIDALTRLRAPGLRRLNGIRSMVQWCKWATRAQP